jgi:hypothetical protein
VSHNDVGGFSCHISNYRPANDTSINLPHAGSSYFNLPKEDIIALLKELRALGFIMPANLIVQVNQHGDDYE